MTGIVGDYKKSVYGWLWLINNGYDMIMAACQL